MRIACLRVPLFPLAARLRSEPDLAGEAVAVVDGEGGTARVVAATRRARRAGVESGQTLPQARALVPGLATRPRDAACERSAAEALFEVAGRFSPRVEEPEDGILFLDVAGLERRFAPREEDAGAVDRLGSDGEDGEKERDGEAEGAGPHLRGPADRIAASPAAAVAETEEERAARRAAAAEEALARALAEATREASLPAWVGIAGSKLAARVAAELGGGPRRVPPGEEAAFLAPLPLARLAPELAVAETLERWGVRSVGELARLPAAEVASRLGSPGRRLHALARGLDPHPLVPREPSPVLSEGMRLEWPLTSLEPFLFVARATLERLCRRLGSQGLGVRRLGIVLDLEPDGHDERSIELPAPTRETKPLLALVRLRLEERPPGAPVVGFAFTAEVDRPQTGQLTLFGAPALAPDRLATTLARLFATLGPDRVGSPRPADDHRPESFELVPFAPPPPPAEPPEAPPARGRGLLAVRVLRPPVELEVLVEGGPGDGNGGSGQAGEAGEHGEVSAARPRELRPIAAEESVRRPRLAGRVRVAAGPWEVEEAWWAGGDAVRRDYWDVELDRGGLYRIYRERGSGRWWADGAYD